MHITTTDGKKLLEEILDLQGQADALEIKQRKILSQVKEKLGTLNDLIVSGQTTSGDEINDFVLVTRGLDLKAEERIRDINKSLKNKLGQLIVGVTKKESYMGCTGLGTAVRPENWTLIETIYLGTLVGDSLILNRKYSSPTLPFSPQMVRWDNHSRVEETSNVNMWGLNIMNHLNAPLTLENSNNTNLDGTIPYQVEIAIGDTEVKSWFSHPNNKKHLENFKRALEILIPPGHSAF